MRRRRALVQAVACAALALATAAAVLPGAFLAGWLGARAAPALTLEFLTAAPRQFVHAGGIGPAITGTLLLVLGTAAVGLPLGVGTAIYLAEYARPGPGTDLVRAAVRNLAGVPSVVYGLFGLSAFVLGLDLGVSALSGSLTLGLLVLPVVVSVAEEALRDVPRAPREAAAALGATPWQVVRHGVLPQAAAPILAGAAVALARAAGEAAPILFTAVALRAPHLPLSHLHPVMALPYHIYALATQASRTDPARIYATALVLVALVLGVNLLALALRAHLRRRP